MKEHVELVITKNLDGLIEHTNLSTGIYASVTSKEILTWDECDDLESIQSRQKRCMAFYRLVKTRIDNFDPLIQILDKCCQSGAVEILKNAMATIEAKEFQQSYPGISMRFKKPEWSCVIRDVMASKRKLIIEGMSVAITSSRIKSVISNSMWFKAEDARSVSFVDKIESVYKRNLNATLLVLEGPGLDNAYDNIHKQFKDLPVIWFEPMQDLKKGTLDLVQDLVTWEDVLDDDKCKAMDNLVEFQVPNKRIGLFKLNEQLGGSINDLNKYLSNISSKAVRNKYKLNCQFVSFLEGKVPKLCTLKCDPLPKNYIERLFTHEKSILNVNGLKNLSNILLVVSGATVGQLSHWVFEPGEVKQMPTEHDTSVRVLVLEPEPRKNQLLKFETICDCERNLTNRRVAWFQFDSEEEEFVLLKDVISSTTHLTNDASSCFSVEKVPRDIDEGNLLEESYNACSKIIYLEGDRGTGLTSLINSLAEKSANIGNKYVLTCRLSIKDFVGHITTTDASDYFHEFVCHVWDESCCELIKIWLKNSSKIPNFICNVFIDDFYYKKVDIYLVQDIMKMFMSEESIRLWICGSSKLFIRLKLENPGPLVTYKLKPLVERDIKNLMDYHINDNKCEKLLPHIHEFIENWKVITRDQNLSVLGYPYSIMKVIEDSEKKQGFDYFFIGVLYHRLIMRNWDDEEHIDSGDHDLSFQSEYKPFLDALFIIQPDSELFQQNGNCGYYWDVGRTELVEKLHNNPVSMFFLNCLIANHKLISIGKNDIRNLKKFFSSTKDSSNTRHALVHSCAMSGLYHLAHLLISPDLKSETSEDQYRMTLHMATNHVNQNLNKRVHYALSEHPNNWCNSETPCYCSGTIQQLCEARGAVCQVNHHNEWQFVPHNYFYASALSSMPLNQSQTSWVIKRVKKLSYPEFKYHQNSNGASHKHIFI